MNLAHQIIQTFEKKEELYPALTVVEGEKKSKNKTADEIAFEKVMTNIKPDELLLKKSLLTAIESHPLYIEPASDVSESQCFGWNRGLAFKLEALIRGRWVAWFNIIAKGKLEDSDVIPECPFSMFDGRDQVNIMLEKCMDYAYQEGARVDDFMDWILYSFGISWTKKPNISDRLWEKFYNTFDPTLMLLHPSDYLSSFLASHNKSGLGGYFPTPLNVTIMINKMLGADTQKSRTESTYEPCLGAGALVLPSESLCLVGTDLN